MAVAKTALQTNGRWFRDRSDRALLRRGFDLGGDCRIPYGLAEALLTATVFNDHTTVGFIGCPFLPKGYNIGKS
jgi:hypothetical protein